MKTIILTAMLFTLFILSGCGGSESVQSETAKQEEVSVLINNAKSNTIIPENQLKSNISYTHLSVSGSRYKFE